MKQTVLLFALAGAMLLVHTGCGDGANSCTDRDGNGVASESIIAVAGDFVAAGTITQIGVPSLSVACGAPAGAALSDPVVRAVGESVFIVNRFGGDNVTLLDAADRSRVAAQYATGPGSNPQDVAVVGNKLYVVTFSGSDLLVIDRSMPQATPATVDLSSLDPVDGAPNCTSLQLIGDELLISCGVRDDEDDFLTPRGPARVAVIDTVTDTLVREFALTNPGPNGVISFVEGLGALLGAVPSFVNLTEGCLESFDADGSLGCLVQNTELGGFVATTEPDRQGGVLAIVTSGFDESDSGPLSELVRLTEGAVSSPFTAEVAPERPIDVAVCPSGHIAVAEVNRGVRIYDPNGVEITDGPIGIGLPPIQDGLVCL